MATESYITLTAHFITSEQKSYILAKRNMPERHTGVHIEEHVLQLLSGWNLDKATFPRQLTMLATWKLLLLVPNWKQIHCVAHTLNLCVDEGLQKPAV